MVLEKTWEEETRELIEDVEHEKVRAEEKVRDAQETLDKVQEKWSALHIALKTYQLKHGVDTVIAEANEILERYQALAPKQMLEAWQSAHEGVIVMKEACRVLVAAGLFRDKVQAAGSLYSVVRRAPECEWMRKGVYRWRVEGTETSESQALADSRADARRFVETAARLTDAPIPQELGITYRVVAPVVTGGR